MLGCANTAVLCALFMSVVLKLDTVIIRFPVKKDGTVVEHRLQMYCHETYSHNSTHTHTPKADTLPQSAAQGKNNGWG